MSIDPAQLRRRVTALPALPQAALEALAALRDDELDAEHCAEPITRDPALAGRTLRLANSAFYGVPGRVGSVQDAVRMLGRRTLDTLITAATLSSQFQAAQAPGFAFDEFWRHALGTAIAARALAREAQLDADVAFTAGLLHDIGRLALATYYPAELAHAVAQAAEHDEPLCAVEWRLLGVDHADLGALIAAQWQLPPAVVQAIRAHHGLGADARGGPSLAQVVHLADAVTHALDLSQSAGEMVPELSPSAWQPPAEQLLAVFDETERSVHTLCEALGLGAGA
jgi:putative nucleotidyltransferase with HDIG domain